MHPGRSGGEVGRSRSSNLRDHHRHPRNRPGQQGWNPDPRRNWGEYKMKLRLLCFVALVALLVCACRPPLSTSIAHQRETCVVVDVQRSGEYYSTIDTIELSDSTGV